MKNIAIIALIALVSTVTVAPAADKSLAVEKAEEFAKAAVNYATAADARVETAEALLAAAREYRELDYADERARKRNVRTAGEREKAAGALLAAACSGYDKSAAAWNRAASEYKRAGNVDKAKEMTTAANEVTQVGTGACKQSAEAYEAATEAYSTIDLGQMAAVSERAAQMREALARRIK